MVNLLLLAVLVVLAILAAGAYNKLVGARNRFKNAFAQIDVQLQRRYDLVPNLVETARAYMAHEKDTLSNVIAARNQAFAAARTAASGVDSGDNIARLAQAEGVLGTALGRLFAVAENYPDLKANTTMQQLMEEMSSTENRVSFARQAFNDAVMEYNTAREVFPATLVAAAFGFSLAQQLDITSPEAREPLRVSFR